MPNSIAALLIIRSGGSPASTSTRSIRKTINQLFKWCKRQSRTEAGEEENYNPVKNAYAALWSEYLELHNEIPLMNVIHRILDFCFMDMCGRDGFALRDEILVKQRERFIITRPDGTEDRTLFSLADSMLQYMGAGVEDNMSFDADGADVEDIRKTFKMIFQRLGQSAHYELMEERARQG